MALPPFYCAYSQLKPFAYGFLIDPLQAFIMVEYQMLVSNDAPRIDELACISSFVNTFLLVVTNLFDRY